MNVDGWVENKEDECSARNDVIMGDGEKRLIQPFSANVHRGIRIERRHKFIGVGRHHKIGQSSLGRSILHLSIFFNGAYSLHFPVPRKWPF